MSSRPILDPEIFNLTIDQVLHPDEEPFEFPENNDPLSRLPDTTPYAIVARDDWGAREPAYTRKMIHPIKNVRFVYEDLKKYDKDNIINALRLCQQHHIEEKRVFDIPYNFLIGKDGIIFEGRGWDAAPASVDKSGDTLDICFIGNYKAEMHCPPYSMMQAAHSLIQTGVKEELIEPNHNIISLKTGADASAKEREWFQVWNKYD